MIEWAPTVVALLGAPLMGYIGVHVGQARMDERLKALKEEVQFIKDELFGTNKIKERLHKAEAELIFQKRDIQELKER